MLRMYAEDALTLPLIISSQALLVVPPEKIVALPLQVRVDMSMPTSCQLTSLVLANAEPSGPGNNTSVCAWSFHIYILLASRI